MVSSQVYRSFLASSRIRRGYSRRSLALRTSIRAGHYGPQPLPSNVQCISIALACASCYGAGLVVAQTVRDSRGQVKIAIRQVVVVAYPAESEYRS